MARYIWSGWWFLMTEWVMLELCCDLMCLCCRGFCWSTMRRSLEIKLISLRSGRLSDGFRKQKRHNTIRFISNQTTASLKIKKITWFCLEIKSPEFPENLCQTIHGMHYCVCVCVCVCVCRLRVSMWQTDPKL